MPRLERRTSLSLKEEEKALIFGLMRYYGLSKEAVRDIFRKFPRMLNLGIGTIAERLVDIYDMPAKTDYKSKLETKAAFDFYMREYFSNFQGFDPVEIVKTFLLERRRFSNEEKSLIVGLHRYYGLKGVSIAKIFLSKKGRVVNGSNLQILYSKPEAEVDEFNLFAGQEDFEAAAVAYFGFADKSDMLKMIETLKSAEQTSYTDDDRRLVYGLSKYAELDSKVISKLLNRLYPDRFGELTSAQVSLLIGRVRKTELANVAKEEVEGILGVNLDDLKIIYGNLVVNEKQKYSTGKIQIMLGFLDYVGGMEGLRKFMVKHFGYREDAGRPYTKVSDFEERLARGEIKKISSDEFLREVKKLGAYTSIEDLVKEFSMGKIEVEERTDDLRKVERCRVYVGQEGIDKLMSNLLSAALSGKTYGLPVSVVVHSPYTDKSLSLLRVGDKSGLGHVLRIRITILEENVMESENIRVKKRQVRGLVYQLTRPGNIAEILDFVRGRGVAADGVILEIYEIIKKNYARGSEQIYKSTCIHPLANLKPVEGFGEAKK